MAFGRNNREDDDTTPETPDPEVVAAEAAIIEALHPASGQPEDVTPEVAPDPYAFLATAGVFAPVEHMKPLPVEDDVPLALRNAIETALTEGVPYRIGLPNADLVKPTLKHLKAYAVSRAAGRIVVRAAIQRDGVTIHLTAKYPGGKAPVAAETTTEVPAE